MRKSAEIQLSVVAPCFNEQHVLHEFLRRISQACASCVDGSYEIVAVNDGSSDGTWRMIAEAANASPHVVGINLSRNHGHQLAVSAGLSFARGDRVLIIDADLQDPPELLSEMMTLMDGGADVVYGKRRTRSGESQFKLITAKWFYRLQQKITNIDIPTDTGDFRLINRRTADLLQGMPEQQRFLRGMVAWLGGRQVPLLYDRDARFAGETKYTLRKMVRLAIDGLTAFSAAPLRLATGFALLAGALSIIFAAYALYSHFFLDAAPGWTSLMGVILFFAAAQLLSIGILGEYLGRIYVESKRRPLFIIQDVIQSPLAEALTPGRVASESVPR